jgi:type IV fimbrial biogenesis protein FimT
MDRTKLRGLTLVEASTATAIAAAALTTAVGGFGDLLQRRHTEGVAAELSGDLQLARTESVMRNAGVRLGFEGGVDGARCYVIHTGSAGACTCLGASQPVCSGDAVAIKTVQFPSDGRTSVHANVGSMLFDPTRATVTPTATIQVRSPDGRQINHIVNILGRVRSCAAAGQWPGLRPC